MRKRSIFTAGILVVLLTFGLVLTGCPTDSGGGGGGGGNIATIIINSEYKDGEWIKNKGRVG